MSFINEKAVESIRKARRCSGCTHMIEVGSPAISWAGMTDGEFNTATYHPECREAEIALNKLQDTYSADEWSSLADIDWEDHRWLLEEYPEIAARRGITAETIREIEEERARCHAAWRAKP